MHDLCTRADRGDLLYHAGGGKRALVPDDLLVRLPELLLHEVAYGVGHDVIEVGVLISEGPGVVGQPPLQLLRTGEGAVQGVGLALAEELALPPAEDLRMGVEEPHQPGSPRFRTPYEEEHRYDLVRSAARGSPGQSRPRPQPVGFFAGYGPPRSPRSRIA